MIIAASGMLNTVARTQASTSIPRYVAASLSNLVTLAPISSAIDTKETGK